MKKKKTIYVADHLEKCEGITAQTCMLIKENKTDDWTYFYDAIEGFTYEKGYEYVLKVNISKIKNPPTDASSLVYKLVEIISKNKTLLPNTNMETNTSIYGKWMVTSINNFENKTEKSPFFVIKEGEISGNTGCNTFGGSLKNDTLGVFQTGMLRMTRMYCEKTASLETAFTTALGKAVEYSLSSDVLTVFDEQKNPLFTASLETDKTKEVTTDKEETISIRYSSTSRGFGSSIRLVGNSLIYEVIRPTTEKTTKELSKSELNEILDLVSKLDLESIEKLEPPSKAHQYDGAPGGEFTITIGEKTYRTPTFDYANPPAAIKELVDKLVTFKDNLK